MDVLSISFIYEIQSKKLRSGQVTDIPENPQYTFSDRPCHREKIT